MIVLNISRHKRVTFETIVVPLTPAFLSYLRADGILLPPEQSNASQPQESLGDEDESEDEDPLQSWPEVHAAIQSAIHELGGKVYPKLNWSAPKDATWMLATNSMECTTANDIYLLLKSSDFITHDLEQAFVGCEDDPSEVEIPYVLALRKAVPATVNSMEFRCFVRRRSLMGVCPRDLNYYDFMESLSLVLEDLICDFFEDKLRDKFPDENFVFDVYIPEPVAGGLVRLIDINPWAQRTDPLLFSWLELLTMPEPKEITDTDFEDDPWLPEFRFVKRGDPEAHTFNAPRYSAHKLPKDVVDAGISGEGGIRDFLNRWERRQADPEYDSENEDH